MENMLTRLRKVFEDSGESQTAIAKKTNVTSAYIWKILNKDNVSPSDLFINSVCREFGVNEVWLRTGEGGEKNMFTQISEDDRYSLNLGKLSVTENEFIKNGVNLLAETDPEKLKILEEFMKSWLGIK